MILCDIITDGKEILLDDFWFLCCAMNLNSRFFTYSEALLEQLAILFCDALINNKIIIIFIQEAALTNVVFREVLN